MENSQTTSTRGTNISTNSTDPDRNAGGDELHSFEIIPTLVICTFIGFMILYCLYRGVHDIFYYDDGDLESGIDPAAEERECKKQKLEKACPKMMPRDVEKHCNRCHFGTFELPDLLECSVCLEGLNDEDSVRQLPCRHVFHAKCIDHWFCKGHNNCPLCKHAIVEEQINPERYQTRPEPARAEVV